MKNAKPATPRTDKSQLVAKCLVAFNALLGTATDKAKEFGAKGDFDSKEATMAYRRADVLHDVVRSLGGLSYLSALMAYSQLGTPALLDLGFTLGQEAELTEDMRLLAVPQVGDGATVSYVTDRYAGTIVKVSASGATIEVQADSVKNTKQWPEQDYTFERNAAGRTWTARRTTDGGFKVLHSTARVTVGPRSEYQAPEN